MADDGDELVTALGILAGVSAALGIGTTAASLAKGGPKLPKAQPPKTAPPPPPPVAPPPPAPTETQADEGVARERRRQQRRYGVADTLLTSPLGNAGGTTAPSGRTLLGG